MVAIRNRIMYKNVATMFKAIKLILKLPFIPNHPNTIPKKPKTKGKNTLILIIKTNHVSLHNGAKVIIDKINDINEKPF